MRVSTHDAEVPLTTRYVGVGDSDVAYQVVGAGEVDVLFFSGLGSHVELIGADPDYKQLLDQLGTFSVGLARV